MHDKYIRELEPTALWFCLYRLPCLAQEGHNSGTCGARRLKMRLVYVIDAYDPLSLTELLRRLAAALG